ncbi:archaea-specific SMC-related protein [Salinibaculum salinum]|uniref:archaea-specific SMC-related protein n=1 Tax=Salinibaculum salinum TaxID=3131996 RepID=UPI0030EF86D2
MNQEPHQNQLTELYVENIGGIQETSLQLRPGVTALVGENATNRTSLIQAIAAGLGADQYSLKSDSDAGKVSLTVAGETYTRELRRENGDIRADGDPYLERSDIAELYAVLLRSNEIRSAVRESGDLRTLILAPIDTTEINRKISERVDERREVDKQLDRLDSLEEKLVEKQTERGRKQRRLDELETQLGQKTARLDTAEGDQTGDGSDTSELDETLDELNDAQAKLERVSANLRGEKKSLESLRDSKETVDQQYSSLSVPDETRIAALEERIERLRNQKQSLDSTVTELQRVIRFNDRQMADPDSALHRALETEQNDSVAEQLDPSKTTVTCWTCGSQVERASIDEMVDKLRELEAEKTQEKNDLASQIEEVQQELDTLRSQREERAQLESKRNSLEEKIGRREENIAEFEQRKEALRQRVDTLEAEVESLEGSQQDELLVVQQEVSKLRFRKEQVESELDDIDATIDAIESELETREQLQERRDELSAELEELRTRIDRIESEAIEEFNTHMAALLDELDYDNIDRIWMERTEVKVKEGRQKTTETQFDLHVIRKNSDGEVYEDTINHLSESEREIVGLVVALAGYIVHDIHEEVPFMLLDSVEMIDGERLVDLVSYLEQFVPYLVVVLLPDHTQAFEKNPPSQNYTPVHI